MPSMNLKKLFHNLDGKFVNFKDYRIKGIAENSKEVKEGFVFVTLKGTKTEGKNYVNEAVKKGAVCIVTDEKIKNINVTQFITKDTIKIMHKILQRFYGKPDFRIIGVTGTNGKSTIANLLSFVFDKMGIKNGVIGTLSSRVGQKVIYTGYTTPPATHLYRIFNAMKKEGIEYLFMEVTSHGLEQRRIEDIELEGLIYTGITRDHLDFHKTMENYYQAKKKAFNLLKKSSPAIINIENLYGKRVFNEIKNLNKKSYGFYLENLDYRIFIKYISPEGMGVKIEYKGEIEEFETKLIGKFNAYNICASFAMLKELGFKEKEFVKYLAEFKGIEGRLEEIKNNLGIKIYIDYAHTPDALRACFETLKGLLPSRIISVFGAGGNRDKEKRPMMGRIAGEFADIIILTNDNPRYEDPMKIIEDILSGIPEGEKSKVKIEPDRKKAIKMALKLADKGDIVLIAGKGHEDYMEIKGKKIPFSDKEVVKEILEKK